MTRTSRRWLSSVRKVSPARNCRLRLDALEAREVPASFMVTNTNDAGAGSLRQALLDANNLNGADTVDFDASFSVPRTINLASNLFITDAVSINGPGSNIFSLSGGFAVRLFNLNTAAGADVLISNMSMSKGFSPNGGAIVSSGADITLENCIITGNTSTGRGGVVSHNGTGRDFTMINCQVDGNSAGVGGVLDLAANVNLTLTQTTLSGNTSTTNGGAIRFYDGGTVTATFSKILNNKATGHGGGIFVRAGTGKFNIFNSTIFGNTATGSGGGIASEATVDITLTHSSLTGNSASNSGGGMSLSNGGSFFLDSSVVSGNTISGSGNGGGIFFYGTANASGNRIVNSTLTGNKSTDTGGAVHLLGATGVLTVQNSTIVGNSAQFNGGGLGRFGGSSTLNVESSIVSDNTAGGNPDVFNGAAGNVLTSSAIGNTAGFNFTDNGGNIFGQALKLGPLQDNGGVVFTMLPSLDSPVVNKGTNPAFLNFDARRVGFPRVLGGTPDMGAAEALDTLVRNTNDSGFGSLRLVMADSGSQTGIDTITFDPAVFGTANTITLASGLPEIGDVTIIGPGADLLTINASNTDNFFDVVTFTTASISGLSLTGGIAFEGGAIRVSLGKLTLTNCALFGNNASNGGAIAVTNMGTLDVVGCTISGNSANSNGGGIWTFNGSTVTVANSTIQGNTAQEGGGVFNLGSSTTVRNSTIVGNTATAQGGGVRAFNSVTIESSIVSGNTCLLSPDISTFSTPVNVNFSAIGSSLGFSSLGGNNLAFGSDLKLGPLADNGGPTLTILPAGDSPVVGKGSNPLSLVNEQRGVGFVRNRGGSVDIGAVEATQIVVLNANDAGAGSLRQAILDANSFGGPDTITFDPTFFSSAKTITLTSGELAIDDATTIVGPGPALLTISGNNASRIFNTALPLPNTVMNISGLSLTGGKTSSRGGAINIDDQSVTLTNCAIFGNSATLNGGAIAAKNGGTLVIVDCTISGNTSADDGGGISTYSTLTVTNSTITGNSADSGGAILTFNASSTIRNSTIVGNKAAASGGGIARAGSGTITVESSIISDNICAPSPDVSSSGTVNVNFSAIGSSTGFTLTGTSNFIGLDLLLGTLANNGGPTQTILPLPGSPLVDAGSNPASLKTDQRGQQRIVGTTIDIGATEAFNLVVTNVNDSGSGSLRQTIQHANSVAGANTISFDPTAFASAQTIKLTTGELSIADSTTINGTGAAKLTINGNNVSRIFTFNSAGGLVAVVSNVTLTGGMASGSLGGGAILMAGTDLSINDSVLTGNKANRDGGAIYSSVSGTLTVLRSTISGNTAAHLSTLGAGGAIFSRGGNFSILDSAITGNVVAGSNATYNNGGAIEVFQGANKTWVVRNSTIAGNSAFAGGGGILMFNSTGTLTVANSTIAGNTANTGSGGGIAFNNSSVTVALDSSIVAGNVSVANANEDLFTTGIVNANFSGIGTKTGASTFNGDATTNALLGQDFKLGALANNGGPTQTILPLPGSPAVDAGSNPASLTTDQRGVQRVVGTQIDIGAAEAINLVVVNTNDSGSGSLRQTIHHANSVAGTNLITFDPTVFATAKTITLTSGELAISESANIAGTTANLLTISGNNNSRIFNVTAPGGSMVAFSGMTLTGGKVNGGGAAINLQNQFLSLSLVDSALVGNSAAGDGGAIQGGQFTAMTIADSTFSGNTAGAAGGAITCFGTLQLTNTTVANNSANSSGGGLAGNFGAAFTIRNSTIVGNTTSGSGGGIGLGGSTATITSSIVAGNNNAVGPDIFSNGTVTANFSAIGSKTGVTTFTGDTTTNALLGQDFKLGALANNGGPTQTIALQWGSPAINAGSNPAVLSTDQRGKTRAVGPIDIGAFELQPAATVASVVLNNGANQRSLVTTIKVTFNQPVIFTGTPAAAFQLDRQGGGTVILNVVMDPANTFATITFTGGSVNGTSLADGRYTLTVLANQIGADGLDGDGNGNGGDNFLLTGSPALAPKLFRYFGDADGDGDVDNTDFVAFRTAFGAGPSIFNFDGDGDTDNADFTQFRTRFGTMV